MLFPSPPPSRRGTPCNSPELDKAKGGRQSSARRTPDFWVENTSEFQSHSSSLRPGHCHSESDGFSVLSGHSYGGGFGWGAGGDGRETSDSEMDTAMHETGRAPRAKEVGESEPDQQAANPKSGPGVQVRASKTQNSPENAARERSRVRNLRQAFQSLQAALPSVPPDTKLSKLDVLVLATNYIAHLTETLDQGAAGSDHAALQRAEGYLHPVKKWPMRSLLYCGNIGEGLTGANPSQE
ncbi:hypothetical protein QTP86_026852, partial [Hemibagrus guttatus]